MPTRAPIAETKLTLPEAEPRYDRENEQETRRLIEVALARASVGGSIFGWLDPALGVQGDIIYHNGTEWVVLPAGTSGWVLKTNGPSGNPEWVAPSGAGGLIDVHDLRVWERFVHPASGTIGVYGSSVGYTGAGSTLATADADGDYLRHTPAVATAGQVTSQLPNAFTTTARRRQGIFISNTKSDADVSSMRLWNGFFSASPSGADDPALNLAAFRYSTGAGDTNLMACVKDGPAGTLNAVSTGVAVTANTKYLLRVEMDASEVRFYVNGTLTNTLTANLPTSSQTLGEAFTLTLLANAARYWHWAGIRVIHRQ